MTGCPELAVLEARGWSDAIRTHVSDCGSCKLVMELIDERSQAESSRDRRAECARFEALIAVRVTGQLGDTAAKLLDEHVRECADCHALANTIAPNDPACDHDSLRTIDATEYALGPELARGGMGRIIEARDLRIGRPVAVKELLAKTSTQAARFEREARVTARLQHPSIVPIYEIGRWESGTPFYTMRMVKGRTLRSAIQASKSFSERLALLPSVLAAAEAVAFAHAHAIIHRDLTPANIMVGDYGETVVIDWGLAKDLSDRTDDTEDAHPYRADPSTSGDLTVAGAVIGTASYMPPEQASGKRVDARADVYSLGAILYYVLAGQAPYRGSSDDVLAAVQRDPPPALPITVPRDLVSIVDKAMSRDPENRYPTARELAAELRRFQTGRLVEAHQYSRRERLRRWIREHRAAVIATSIGSLAAIVAGTIAFASIVRERDRAEQERVIAVDARADAQRQNSSLMAEQGRQELLAGNTTRALAWLNEAYKAGDTSPELRFMLGKALETVEAVEHTFHCSSESIEFSADGKHLLAACSFGIGLTRVEDWKVVTEIEARSEGAKLSHNGRLIANRHYTLLTLYDAQTGAELFSHREHTDRIRNISFTPDDRLLVSTGDDAKIRVWDVATGKVLRTIDAGNGKMNVVRGAISPDGKSIVSFTADGVVQVWDLETGTRKRRIELPTQHLFGNTTPDGKRLVGCGTDGKVRIVDLDSGQIASTLPAHTHAAVHCEFSTDGRRLLTAGFDGIVRLWDARTEEVLATLRHGGTITSGRLSPDGERIVTIAIDGTLKLWHAASASLISSVDDPFGNKDDAVFSPDGKRLITSRQPSLAMAWNGIEGGMRSVVLADGAIAIAASPTGKHFVVKLRDESLSIVDVATSKPVSIQFREPYGWSRDGKRIATTTDDGVNVFDVTTGGTIARIASKPTELALDERGQRLLVTAAKSELWDVERQQRILEITATTDNDSLSRDGKLLVAWKDSRNVEIWNTVEQRIQATVVLDGTMLGAVGFQSGGRRVVIMERDLSITNANSLPFIGTLHIVDTATGKRVFSTTNASFTTVDASGTYVVTSGLNKRIDVRQIEDGKLLSSMSPGPAFFMVGEALGNAALLLVASDNGLSIRSAVDGRPLWVMQPVLKRPRFTQDTFHADGYDTFVAMDGRTIAMPSTSPIVWKLPREERSPAEVDKIVQERVRWKVVDGHLVPRDATLRGRVVHHGKPSPRATIGFQAGGTVGWLIVRADAEGRFEIPAMRYGQYGIGSLAADKLASGEKLVTIDREVVTTEIELDVEGKISGQVIDEQNQPIPGVRVGAGRDPGPTHAVTDANGNFTIGAKNAGEKDVVVFRNFEGKPTGFDAVSPIKVTLKSKTDHVTGVRVVVRRTTN